MNTTPIFDRIAKRYDLLNHLFSISLDKFWRGRMLNSLKAETKENCTVLDMACGTGDFSILLAENGYNVVGLDLSESMLDIAKERVSKCLSEGKIKSKESVTFLKRDCCNTLLESSSFDIVTIVYGIRNFDNRALAFNEIKRVLKQGGKLRIMEFGLPQIFFIRFFYRLYFKYWMPIVAQLFLGKQGKNAFRYFYSSVVNFPKYDLFCKEIESFGFKNVTYKRQTFGISVLYSADYVE